MNLHRKTTVRTAPPFPMWTAALFTAALACAFPVRAAQADNPAAQHRAEVAACNDGSSPEGRDTCLYEARSAYAQQVREGIKNGNGDYAGNATQRCNAQQGSERRACLAMMAGRGTRSGSVEGGGILRELVTTSPAPAGTPPTTPGPR